METFRLEGTTKKRPLPSFIKKLWFILNDAASQEYISWADDGQVVCVPDAVNFSKFILPKHFKHNNWQSFVRQLNLYGFRKVYQLSLSYDDAAKDKRTVWQFKHESFQRNQPDKLCDIKRRAAKQHQGQKESPPMAAMDPNVVTMSSSLAPPPPPPPLPPPPPVDSALLHQLDELRDYIDYIDKKRLEYYEETVQLRKTQQDQLEAIRFLTDCIKHISNKHSETKHQLQRLQETVNKLTTLQSQPYPSEYDDIDDESRSSSHSPYHHPLPSINSIIGNNQMLPPLRPRPPNL